MDPLAADYAAWSPYNYVLGNPVIFIDPSGMAPEGWSQANADLADIFGLFGNGSDTYTSNFGEYNETSNDPVLYSGEVTSGNGNAVHDEYPSSVDDFVEETNALPRAKTDLNIITIVVALPYSKDGASMNNGNFDPRANSQYKIDGILAISDFHEELAGPIKDAISPFTNSITPIFDLRTLGQAYGFARESIENANIIGRTIINTSVRINRVSCGQTGSMSCANSDHSPSVNTVITYELRRIPQS